MVFCLWFFRWKGSLDRSFSYCKEQTGCPPHFKGEIRHSANQRHRKGDFFLSGNQSHPNVDILMES
jgi:hypothetical protein